MKTVKLLSISFILLFAFGLNSTAKKTDNQIRKVRDFNAIKVSSGIDLYLTQANTEKVTIKADQKIIDKIVTKVKDGVLHIYLDKNMSWGWGLNQERKAYVSFDDLEAISASAGSDVYSENNFKLENLKVDASSGSDIRLDDVKADKIWVATSSGSDAYISGKTSYLEARASSGSDIHASELISKDCEVRVSSGSDAKVHATVSIKAHASSGGDIRYRGNPKYKDTHESSGGDISGY